MGKKKIFVNVFMLGRDISIISILRKYNLDYAVIAYNLATYNVTEHIINIILMKYGLPPIVGLILIALI